MAKILNVQSLLRPSWQIINLFSFHKVVSRVTYTKSSVFHLVLLKFSASFREDESTKSRHFLLKSVYKNPVTSFPDFLPLPRCAESESGLVSWWFWLYRVNFHFLLQCHGVHVLFHLGDYSLYCPHKYIAYFTSPF